MDTYNGDYLTNEFQSGSSLCDENLDCDFTNDGSFTLDCEFPQTNANGEEQFLSAFFESTVDVWGKSASLLFGEETPVVHSLLIPCICQCISRLELVAISTLWEQMKFIN